MPSTAQIRAASSRMVEVLSHAGVKRRIRRERPDVVLMACTGPVVAALTDQRTLWSGHRPLLVTGLPGISVPATRRAVTARAACDLFLLHSKREIAEFADMGARYAPRLVFGLAPLPFLPRCTPTTGADSPLGHNLIFAAQAKVPVERPQREQIVLALADAGSAVIKLRGWSEEQQTHREIWSYPEIGQRPGGAAPYICRRRRLRWRLDAGCTRHCSWLRNGLIYRSTRSDGDEPARLDHLRLRSVGRDDQSGIRGLGLPRHPE